MPRIPNDQFATKNTRHTNKASCIHFVLCVPFVAKFQGNGQPYLQRGCLPMPGSGRGGLKEGVCFRMGDFWWRLAVDGALMILLKRLPPAWKHRRPSARPQPD